MNPTRKTALVAGIFYLITEVTAIAAMLSYGPILTDPTFIVSASGDDTGVLIGAYLEVLLAIAVVGSSVTLYPVIKAYGGGLALGYVAGRLIEAAIILVGAMSLLTILTLRHGGGADADAAVTVGRSLVALHDWTFLFGPKLALGVNTMIISESGGSEGVGLAIPSNIAKSVTEQIIKNGLVRRGEIGIEPQTITDTMAEALGLPRQTGVILGDVTPDGPAHRAPSQPFWPARRPASHSIAQPARFD